MTLTILKSIAHFSNFLLKPLFIIELLILAVVLFTGHFGWAIKVANYLFFNLVLIFLLSWYEKK